MTAGASLTKIIEYALHRYCSDGIVHVCNGDESGSLIVCRCGGTFVVQQRSRVEIGNTRESMWLTPDVTSICPEGMLNHSAIEGGDFPLWDDLAYDLAALPRGVRRKELLRTGVPCTREEKIDVPERAPEVTPLSRASLEKVISLMPSTCTAAVIQCAPLATRPVARVMARFWYNILRDTRYGGETRPVNTWNARPCVLMGLTPLIQCVVENIRFGMTLRMD